MSIKHTVQSLLNWPIMLALAFSVSGIVYAAGTGIERFVQNNNTAKEIDAHSVCKSITNASSYNVFVPINTSPEWQSAYTSPPPNVNYSDCATGGGTPGGGPPQCLYCNEDQAICREVCGTTAAGYSCENQCDIFPGTCYTADC